MSTRALLLAGALLPACSFAFVDGPDDAMLKQRAPITCTTSRALPLADLVVGAALGALVVGVTYAAVDEVNEDCPSGQCQSARGPALIGGFLVVSPWWISAAVGASDTQQCRRARARASAPP